MRFSEAVIQATSGRLKRIRIKIDPAYAAEGNYQLIDSYEGYVLEESAETIRIMVIKKGMPVFDLPRQCLITPDPLSGFKTFLINQILDVKELTECKKNTQNLEIDINAAPTFDDIETYLLQNGCTDTGIAKLYKGYLKTL